MSGEPKYEGLVLGGEPRVDLLPLEVRKERKAKVARRRLGAGVVGVIVVVLAASGGATALSMQAQAQLLDEQDRTATLLAEQGKYVEVRSVQEQVNLAQAAQQVGASTEINWKSYLESVQATLPAGVTIDTVNLDSASPMAVYDQPTAPLQGARVATLNFAAKSATLPDVPAWLSALATLPGYSDALPNSVDLDDGTGIYTVNITMHVNDAAFAQRFATKEK